jgi:hypothetical protein
VADLRVHGSYKGHSEILHCVAVIIFANCETISSKPLLKNITVHANENTKIFEESTEY